MLLPVSKKEDYFYFFQELNRQIFEVALISYLLFYLLDDLFNRLVSNYFNLNIILIIVIISGVLLNLPGLSLKERESKQKPAGVKDYILIIALGMISAVIIFYKIDLSLWLRISISFISGLIIILLSVLLLNENNEENL